MEYCCLNIVEGRRRRRGRNRFKEWRLFLLSLTISLFFFFLCFCTTNNISNPLILSESMSLLSIETDGISSKDLGRNYVEIRGRNGGTRRLLGGPGSSPPQCRSKCNGCTPCKAVHVPVPPGTPVTTEYYPEAWRCKCRNKFYMP